VGDAIERADSTAAQRSARRSDGDARSASACTRTHRPCARRTFDRSPEAAVLPRGDAQARAEFDEVYRDAIGVSGATGP
jgi:hypothetical protein